MTNRARQKRGERSVVLQAALKLKVSWHLQADDREEPDFIIKDQRGVFGLEVTECHIGSVGKGGSKRRQQESFNQKWLNNVVSVFLREKDVNLKLDYVGPANDQGKNAILAFLEREKFEKRQELSKAVWHGERMMVQAYRDIYSQNVFVNDRVGWVQKSVEPLQAAIDKKVPLLTKYRQVCSDIRLLVVADRIYNSGKMILLDGFKPDLKGFNEVYFFSYPENVTVFHASPSP